MSKPMFSVTHTPIFVGSYLRNTGFGSRIMVVTKIKPNKHGILMATAITYGSTNKGNFKPAKRHKSVTGVISKCYICSNKCIVAVLGTNTWWHYQHVVRN